MNTIDCRNMPCPAPVIAAKKALEEQGAIRILLDDGAPRENVARFARNRGFQLREEKQGDGWAVDIAPVATGTAVQMPLPAAANCSGTILLITSEMLGNGPEELGRLLMRNLIHTLVESEQLPASLFFLNSGVLLTTEGSAVLEALQKLVVMGVEIMSCGLCLDYYGIKDKLMVGGTTNMLATLESILGEHKVIKL